MKSPAQIANAIGVGQANRTHGATVGRTRTGRVAPEYKSWCSMRGRCLNPRSDDFPHYGGRGITVCDRWKSYEAFLEDMGPRPSVRHSLDRIDNDGNYEPGNCRWATPEEQESNKRRTRLIEFQGVALTQAQWARRLGLSEGLIARRLKAGWPLRLVLSTTLRQGDRSIPKEKD